MRKQAVPIPIWTFSFCVGFCSVLGSGCLPNLYKVDAEIRDLKLEDRSSAPSDSAERGWYYSKIGTKNEKTIIRFVKFGEGYGDQRGSVVEGKLYSVEERQLAEGFKVTYKQGWSFGTLVVPFKFRPKRYGTPSNIFASSSLGSFLGYKWRLWEGTEITPAAFAGLATVTINDVNTQNVDNLFGLSYGGGIVFEITSSFQLGAVVGWDYIGGARGAAWLYRNARWTSFSIGYKFLNF